MPLVHRSQQNNTPAPHWSARCHTFLCLHPFEVVQLPPDEIPLVLDGFVQLMQALEHVLH